MHKTYDAWVQASGGKCFSTSRNWTFVISSLFCIIRADHFCLYFEGFMYLSVLKLQSIYIIYVYFLINVLSFFWTSSLYLWTIHHDVHFPVPLFYLFATISKPSQKRELHCDVEYFISCRIFWKITCSSWSLTDVYVLHWICVWFPI
jgi:hypothetical protein